MKYITKIHNSTTANCFEGNIFPFFNIADKPAFMLLSLRRGRDWKTWLTEIEEEGCIGKIVEELI